MKLREYFLCTKKTKITTLFHNFFSSVSLPYTVVNKVVIFVFFAHRNYSHSFITIWLNQWCYMDYCNNVLNNFLDLKLVSCVTVYTGSESSWTSSKIFNLCSKDEQRSSKFGTAWGWVINDGIFIFGWTIPSKTIWYCTSCTYGVYNQLINPNLIKPENLGITVFRWKTWHRIQAREEIVQSFSVWATIDLFERTQLELMHKEISINVLPNQNR